MMSVTIGSNGITKASLTPKDVKHLFDTGICPFCCIYIVNELPACEVAAYVVMSDADTILIQGTNAAVTGSLTTNAWTIE